MFEDLLKVKLEQIRTVGKTVVSGFVPDEIAEQRYNICLECEYFDNKICSICGCYMPLKIIFKNGVCPNKYWGTYPEESP